MTDSILYYKFSNTDQSLTGNLSFKQVAADDQQVTLEEGLNISATYNGQSYTQTDDAQALLLTNTLGEIADQGLGLQFVTNAFTVNADVFLDADTDQSIIYTQLYAPTNLVFNTIYNFSNTNKTFTGSFSFNQAAADDQQVTLEEGLNISAAYNGQSYTQIDDAQALLLTNTLGEITEQGLGLQFVTNAFTVNADVFFDENADETITYTLVQAPTNSELSAISLNENIASGTIINSFSTVDQDSNTFTYTLVAGTGDTNNSAFTIDGNNLKINISPNFEAQSTYNIRVKTTDQDGLFFEKPLTVTINDLNEAPTDLVFNTIYNFSNVDKTLTGSISFNQATVNDQQVTIAEGLKISFTYDGKIYTEADDSLAVLFTNQLGEINEQGLGLQFVTDTFTINADNFIDENSIQTINYTRSQAPTNLDLSAISINENIAVATVIASFNTIDPDTENNFNYSLVAGTGDTDNSAFTIAGDKLQINISPNFEAQSTYNIRVKTTDQDGLSFEKPLTITVNNIVIPPQLTKVSNDVFNIKGDNNKGILKVTISSSTPNSNQLNELGVYTVDDASGKIGTLNPGDIGYAAAALARAKVLFSTIANFPSGDNNFNNSNVNRLLQLDYGTNLRFYLVQGSTTQTVINKGNYSEVVFSSNQNIKDLGNNAFSVEFSNLKVLAEATNQSLDSGLINTFGQQGSTKGTLLYVSNQVNATFTINSEAAYKNFVGFYQVTDETGTINLNGTVYKPGDSGYTQAAINSRIVEFTGTNQVTIASTGKFDANAIFAPFIIANGDPSTYINGGNPVYFSFLGANPSSDKQVDHIRLLGNNTFGFEDLPGGGDMDYNDIIVRVTLA